MYIAPRGQHHLGITSILLVLAVIVAYLRFISRRRARLDVRADDWTLLVALTLVFAIYVEGLVWLLHGGLGQHASELSPAQLTVFFKCYLAAWLTFAAAFVATKVSILLLYLRIFPIQKLRYACAFLGSLVIGQGICIFTLGLCQCRPFRYIWDKAISGGVCLATTSVFYGSAITTLLLNTAILCVPLPIIWGLQMKKSYRLALTAVFSTGGLVCVAGIVRVTAVQTFDPLDISYTLVESAILIIVEPCVAIVSACIPTLAPAVRDMTSWSIIEYKKMILRITNTQFEPDRPLSVERATVEELPMFEGMKQPIRPRLGVRYDSLDILFDFSRRLSGEKRDLKSEHARGVQREIDVDAS